MSVGIIIVSGTHSSEEKTGMMCLSFRMWCQASEAEPLTNRKYRLARGHHNQTKKRMNVSGLQRMMCGVRLARLNPCPVLASRMSIEERENTQFLGGKKGVRACVEVQCRAVTLRQKIEREKYRQNENEESKTGSDGILTFSFHHLPVLVLV